MLTFHLRQIPVRRYSPYVEPEKKNCYKKGPPTNFFFSILARPDSTTLPTAMAHHPADYTELRSGAVWFREAFEPLRACLQNNERME